MEDDTEPARFWAQVAQFAQGLLARPELAGVQSHYLRHIDRLVSADAYGITALDYATLRPVAVAIRGHADADGFLETYEDIGGRTRDVFFQYILAKRRPVHDRLLFPGGSWFKHLPEYGRLLLQDGLTHVMLVPLVRRGAFVGTMHFNRRASSKPFAQGDLRAAKAITGMTASAIANGLRYADLEDRCAAAEALVSRSPAAVLLSDPNGRIVCESHGAARMRLAWDSLARREFAILLRNSSAEVAQSGKPAQRVWTTIEVGTSPVAGTRGMLMTVLRETTSDDPSLARLSPPLTAREIDVLELVAKGLRDQEVADALHVTVHTVKQHLKRIYQKLHARGRADAVRLAMAAAEAPAGE